MKKLFLIIILSSFSFLNIYSTSLEQESLEQKNLEQKKEEQKIFSQGFEWGFGVAGFLCLFYNFIIVPAREINTIKLKAKEKAKDPNFSPQFLKEAGEPVGQELISWREKNILRKLGEKKFPLLKKFPTVFDPIFGKPNIYTNQKKTQ